jgi:CheY-like chemotaxis protein
MLSPYGVKIETAANGLEVIQLINENHVYDIIFMDHMMPVMDGIETTRILRETGYSHPIIALTANAVMGQSDVFLSNGFDGFVSKPIDMHELNDVLNLYILKKQSPDDIGATRTHSAISKSIDENLIKAVALDIGYAVTALNGMLMEINQSHEADMDLFTTTAHGVKSALLNIGETELSKKAHMLEQAGESKDKAVVLAETPGFIHALQILLDSLQNRSDP